MSDSADTPVAVPAGETPPPTTDSAAPAPDTPALPGVPDGTPPVSVEASAGAEAPPASTPTGEPAAAAPLPDVQPEPLPAVEPEPLPPVEPAPPDVVQSTPATGTEKTSDVIDSQAAAVAALGDDSGIRAPAEPTTLQKVEAVFEHPHEALASLRAKLLVYGEEMHAALQHEIEWLHRFFDRL